MSKKDQLCVITDEISQDFEHALDVALEYGVKTVDLRKIWKKNIADFTDDELSRLKEAVNKRDMKVCVITGPIGKPSLKKAEENLKKFNRIVEISDFFKTDFIRIFTFKIGLKWNIEKFNKVINLFKPIVAKAEELNKTIVLHHSGEFETILSEEFIEDTDLFIAVTEDEEDNILLSLLAKQKGAKKAISLIHNMTYTKFVPSIGIDLVINPNLCAINSILQFIRKGKILSVASFYEKNAEAIEAVALDTSDLVNKPLRKLNWFTRYMQRPNGTASFFRRERQSTLVFPSSRKRLSPD